MQQPRRWRGEQADGRSGHPAQPLRNAGTDQARDVESAASAMRDDEGGVRERLRLQGSPQPTAVQAAVEGNAHHGVASVDQHGRGDRGHHASSGEGGQQRELGCAGERHHRKDQRDRDAPARDARRGSVGQRQYERPRAKAHTHAQSVGERRPRGAVTAYRCQDRVRAGSRVHRRPTACLMKASLTGISLLVC
jgi:hypothetical protein